MKVFDHHLQRSIVYQLAFSPKLKFTQLKPDLIDNKLFTYHLKKVVSAGYVAKGEDGLYALTPEGRRLGTRVLQKQQTLVDGAASVLFLVIRRNEDNQWLLYRRNVHPLLGKTGFMHCAPDYENSITDTAKIKCLERTGVTGDFKPLGGGYFRVFDGENLESFTHFTLMVCENAAGTLVQNDEHAEYYWSDEPEFSESLMLPNMPTLVEYYQAGKTFFVEKTFRI